MGVYLLANFCPSPVWLYQISHIHVGFCVGASVKSIQIPDGILEHYATWCGDVCNYSRLIPFWLLLDSEVPSLLQAQRWRQPKRFDTPMAECVNVDFLRGLDEMPTEMH